MDHTEESTDIKQLQTVEFKYNTCGVPQASLIGPLLFLIYRCGWI